MQNIHCAKAQAKTLAAERAGELYTKYLTLVFLNSLVLYNSL